MSRNTSKKKNSRKIRVFTKVLTTALKLWLRSQVSQISQLEVEIKANDGEILSGCIPWVSILASDAVYQGIYLTEVQLIAENIRINIGSVLKGQALQLLETVRVFGELRIEESDLNASLSSILLSTALNDVMTQILPEYIAKSKLTNWQKIIIEERKILLNGNLCKQSIYEQVDIVIGLSLLGSQKLQLSPIHITKSDENIIKNHTEDIDLGDDVDIQYLNLSKGILACKGTVNVNP
ncbi:DUF2993 domain-containing protein [Mastigocoleus sp. MO_188.B34]|uniref:LmeA family phospholipid-binding protein n=1 Tax=Mastigocoleus sp. MO_188.B34 TaxID=3036635 RepID=UPI0026139E39|nr:DUF2993 domain-containing protein [Mastigocoleus sp. MO_188.B34]MDJ0694679.1 DUF2993 domain-containing protein [Mastigocoleus sp. MO_188.B34]